MVRAVEGQSLGKFGSCILAGSNTILGQVSGSGASPDHQLFLSTRPQHKLSLWDGGVKIKTRLTWFYREGDSQ